MGNESAETVVVMVMMLCNWEMVCPWLENDAFISRNEQMDHRTNNGYVVLAWLEL